MPSHDLKFRFAPSPNGPLHRGHALSALLNGALAKRFEGQFLLRIEDIDIGRSRAEHIQAIESDLHWLGLEWPLPVRRQSEHMADFASAFRTLEAESLVYPCFCSRRAIADAINARADGQDWPQDPDGAPLYPGTCRTLSRAELSSRLASGEIPQARLHMTEALRRVGQLSFRQFDPRDGREWNVMCDAAKWGDVVLVRKDTPTSYHLSVVVDDAIQGITHIVRGQDLAEATAIHIVLQQLLGLPSPAYWHHKLLVDEAGEKLAKSRKSKSLRDEINAGLTRAELIRSFCRDPLFEALLHFENEKPERR